MLEDIQRRLKDAFGRFHVRGVLTEAHVKEGMREVRSALLEADVHLQVVRDFMERIQSKAVGESLIKAVRPDQQIVKIVHDELIEMMGEPDPSIRFEKSGPTVLMLCGLQGSGKTTTTGKLAGYLAAQGRKPLLVAADLQRPAAVEQLQTIGRQLNFPVYTQPGGDPVKICQDSIVEANRQGRDTILLDTAGRLHIDDQLMNELRQIEKKVKPHQVFFVCDALTGQDAVASAKAFHESLTLDGVIMTKLDGDARGGAALSVRHVTGVPIKFIGIGEKLDKLTVFDPQRIVGQMLGMGDIVSLVETAQQAIDQEEALRQQQKMAKGKFDFNDFRQQIAMVKKMGSVKDIISKIPGFGQLPGLDMEGVDADADVKRVQGIIDSMTPEERQDPDLIDHSRRRRIAAGAGVDPSEISQLVKQFDAMAAMVRQMAQMTVLDRIKTLTGMGKSGAFLPGAKLPQAKQSTGKRLSPKEREKLRKEREKEERRRKREQREQGGDRPRP